MKKLELAIFRFDSNKDYESYYKPYVYENYENFSTFYDLFLQIKQDDIYFNFEENEQSYIKVNSLKLPLNTPLDILKQIGYELKIEPLSTKRAIKDFIINKSDFYEKFSLLSCFASKEDEAYYKSLEHYYYTYMLDFLPEYMGDSLFLFAYYLLNKYPNNKLEILKVIHNKTNGLLYHRKTDDTKLESVIFELINHSIELKLLDKNLLDIKFETPTFQKASNTNTKHDFKNFNIALYGFKNDFSKDIKARFIAYEKHEFDTGFSLLNLNKDLAYKMASEIILDAYDSGSDFLITKSKEHFYMFDTCSKELMRASQRDFSDFYILDYDEFLLLSQDQIPTSLKQHKLKVSLV